MVFLGGLQGGCSRSSDRDLKRELITSVFKTLHWLRVLTRIGFEILLLVYKALNGLVPRC